MKFLRAFIILTFLPLPALALNEAAPPHNPAREREGWLYPWSTQGDVTTFSPEQKALLPVLYTGYNADNDTVDAAWKLNKAFISYTALPERIVVVTMLKSMAAENDSACRIDIGVLQSDGHTLHRIALDRDVAELRDARCWEEDASDWRSIPAIATTPFPLSDAEYAFVIQRASHTSGIGRERCNVSDRETRTWFRMRGDAVAPILNLVWQTHDHHCGGTLETAEGDDHKMQTNLAALPEKSGGLNDFEAMVTEEITAGNAAQVKTHRLVTRYRWNAEAYRYAPAP